MQLRCVGCKVRVEHVKRKTEISRLNQIRNKNTPKGAGATFELQVKQHTKRGFKSELQLI